MKKLLIVLLAVLVACAVPVDEPEPTEPVPTPIEEPEEVPEPEVEELPEEVPEEAEETTSSVDELAKVLKPSDRTRIYPINQKLSVGEEFTYAYGIANPDNKERIRGRDIHLRSANEPSGNSIPVDENTVLSWVEFPKNSVVTVPASGILVEPILVKVGATVADGMATKRGSYVFTIVTRETTDKNSGVFKRSDLTIIVE